MSKGTVKFFNESKGFGFISEDGSKKEHFVHISGLIDQIREGDTVEFDLQEGKKGLNAVNVKVICLKEMQLPVRKKWLSLVIEP